MQHVLHNINDGLLGGVQIGGPTLHVIGDEDENNQQGPRGNNNNVPDDLATQNQRLQDMIRKSRPVEAIHAFIQEQAEAVAQDQEGRRRHTLALVNFAPPAPAGSFQGVSGFPKRKCNRRGETVLHVAAGRGLYQVVELLLKCGATPNACANVAQECCEQATPLFQACQNTTNHLFTERIQPESVDYLRVVRLLLDAGANPNIVALQQKQSLFTFGAALELDHGCGSTFALLEIVRHISSAKERDFFIHPPFVDGMLDADTTREMVEHRLELVLTMIRALLEAGSMIGLCDDVCKDSLSSSSSSFCPGTSALITAADAGFVSIVDILCEFMVQRHQCRAKQHSPARQKRARPGDVGAINDDEADDNDNRRTFNSYEILNIRNHAQNHSALGVSSWRFFHGHGQRGQHAEQWWRLHPELANSENGVVHPDRRRQDEFKLILEKLINIYGKYSCVERSLRTILFGIFGDQFDADHMIKLLQAIMDAEPKSVLSRRSRKRDGSLPLKVAWERDFSIGVLFVLLRAHPAALELLVTR